MSRALKILMLVAALVAGLIAVLMMHGCATLRSVAKTCEPAKLDEQQAIVDLFGRTDLTEAEVIATAEAGKVAICVVTEIARDLLNRATGNELALTLSPSAPSPLLSRAAAWVKVHP